MKFVSKDKASLKTKKDIAKYFEERTRTDILTSDVTVNEDCKESFLRSANKSRLDVYLNKEKQFLSDKEYDLALTHLNRGVDEITNEESINEFLGRTSEDNILKQINEVVFVPETTFDDKIPEWMIMNQKINDLPEKLTEKQHLSLSKSIEQEIEEQMKEFDKLLIERDSSEDKIEVNYKLELLSNLLANNNKILKHHFYLGHGLSDAIYSDENELNDIMAMRRQSAKNVHILKEKIKAGDVDSEQLTRILQKEELRLSNVEDVIEDQKEFFANSSSGILSRTNNAISIAKEVYAETLHAVQNLEKNRKDVTSVFDRIKQLEGYKQTPNLKQELQKLNSSKNKLLLNIAIGTNPSDRLKELSRKKELSHYEKFELVKLKEANARKGIDSTLIDMSSGKKVDSKDKYLAKLAQNPNKLMDNAKRQLDTLGKALPEIYSNARSERINKLKKKMNKPKKLSKAEIELNHYNEVSKKRGTFLGIIGYPFRSKERLSRKIAENKVALASAKTESQRNYIKNKIKNNQKALKKKLKKTRPLKNAVLSSAMAIAMIYPPFAMGSIVFGSMLVYKAKNKSLI